MQSSERTRETERRRATVLFADLTGFTALNERLDPERAYELVTTCLKRLDGVARSRGGSVEKVLGDALMVVFGVPLAMEAAAASSLNAAIEMLVAVEAFNRERGLEPPLRLHCGVNSGLMIAGDVSGPLLREFAVMGDAVNVAARLKDLAPPGAVYVGAETQRQAPGFAYRALPALELKGKAERVAAFELTSREPRQDRRERAARGVEFVGREEPLARILARVAALREGRGHLVSVIGEAGLGKSRLLAEAAASEIATQVTWLAGRSLAVGAELAFHPFRDLVRGAVGAGEHESPQATVKQLEAALGPLLGADAAEVEAPIAALLGVHGKRDSVSRTGADAMAKVVLAAISRLLRALAARRPLVVALDDLHWADASSLELLEGLLPLAATEPVLFVLAFRPGFPEASGRLLAHARARYPDRHEEIALEPLAKPAARALLQQLTGGSEVPPSTCERIEARAAGNPFFLEEIVQSLRERGGLAEAAPRAEGAWLPETVQEVIMARIDRLPTPARRLLQVAAVIGRPSPADLLGEIAGEGAPSAFETLVALDFLERHEGGERAEYALRHPLIGDACYDAILRSQREELHREAAHAIRSRMPADAPGYHALLAYHSVRGGDLEAAEEHLLRAGEEASRSAASVEALRFFEEALRVFLDLHGAAGDPRRRARLERGLALAFFDRGRVFEAAAHFDEALRHLGERTPTGRVARRALLLRDLLSVVLALYLPWPRLRRPASELEREIASIQFSKGMAQSTSEPAAFLESGVRGVRLVLARDARSLPESTQFLAWGSALFSYGGLSFPLGQRFLERAREACTSPEARFVYEAVRFMHCHLAGDWSAPAVDEGVLHERLRSGAFFEVVNCVSFATERQMCRGELAAARAGVAWLGEIGRSYAYEPAILSCLGYTFMLDLEQRRLEEAARGADAYVAAAGDQDPLRLIGLAGRAEAQLGRGAWGEARAALEEADLAAARVPFRTPYHWSAYRAARLGLELAALAAALERRDRTETRLWRAASRRSAREALRSARWVAARQPEVFRRKGRREWLLGRRRAGLGWYARSAQTALRLGMRSELARTQREVGLRLRSTPGGPRSLLGATPEACLDQARETFAALGLGWELERMDTLEHP